MPHHFHKSFYIDKIRMQTALLILLFLGCQPYSNPLHHKVGDVREAASANASPLHAIKTSRPPEMQGVVTKNLDPHGKAVVLQCQACHGVRPANNATKQGSELDEFHQGLNMAHGKLTCVSCHNPNDGYSTLRLADGRLLPFAESMQLCAQCHGTQFRDYEHGSHGGMTGHWDLTKGERTRNHCLHCHDPHAPQYPKFMPVAGPRDRFRPASAGENHE